MKIFKATFLVDNFLFYVCFTHQPSLSTIEKCGVSYCHSGYWENCSDSVLGLEFWSVLWLYGPEPSSFCFLSALSWFLRARYLEGLGVMSSLSSSGLEELNDYMAKFFHVIG